jgi:putative inorganic carbon (HCO3(-)) transporter
MPTNIDIAHAHNQFLQVGVDLGIPGLIAYIAIWLGLVGMLQQSWQLANEPLSRLFIVGFTASLVASFVFGLTDTVALGAKPGFMFWFLLGLITGHYRSLVGANDGDNDS